jgi:hypothetical protein
VAAQVSLDDFPHLRIDSETRGELPASCFERQVYGIEIELTWIRRRPEAVT